MRVAPVLLALMLVGCHDTPVDATGVPTQGAYPAANAITGLTMRYVTLDLLVGESKQLSFTPHTTTNGAFIPHSVQWRSSAVTVATVDPNGVVSALSPGQTFVTVTVDGHTGQTTVTVRPGQGG